MTASHYEEIIGSSLQRFRDLYGRREEIDVELAVKRRPSTPEKCTPNSRNTS